MKKISEFIGLDSFGYNSPFISDPELDEMSVKIVNEIFKELRGIVPAHAYTWDCQESFDSCKKAWVRAFMFSKINDLNIINHGLNKLSTQRTTFMPSPGEFIELCQYSHEDIGAPSLERAYSEACMNSHPSSSREWSHDVVYHAWRETGSYELSHLPKNQTFPIFKRNYAISLSKFSKGERLEIIPKGIENEKNIHYGEVTPAGLGAIKKLKEILSH